MAKDGSKIGQAEGNENQFERNLTSSIDIPLSRAPLNAIPDPSQFSKEFYQEVVVHNGFRDKCVEAGSSSNRRKMESAHTTPARSVSRTTYVGQLGACTGPRALQSTGERVGSSSRVSRRISNVNCEPPPTEVPHFELVEDPSFWNDHNVQVLIRMRPLSNTEKMTQGYGRCLRQETLQSLVWLGHPEIRFTFDHIVCETISQEKLFRVAGLPMVDNCMKGYNSCMFAYGQTGSGKTYTMMGEISQRDGKLVDDCGITPRLFEYLFTRIKLEEENRKDERLKYSCKCSFLEIYNEQITDLLEPSSTNLQLREDLKEGVYVENLTEYNVKTVDEVLKLLLQGAANRKVAGTDMNSESSRSHSVFTCIVESRWEKDSMTHLRFGRLNLVDLAGSERQRSSGAGERLKEASYINKSLSTLGLVIMSLVDVAHGKHRHVPYRDSRLTFLLQDSLGGNSKTTIIANVSPSMCAANETLSTLKFAQRAKLIQNNAKVNEDASGDVTALQQQIQILKEQMSLLMKHQKISKPMFQVGPTFQPSVGELFEREDPSDENICDDSDVLNYQKRKVETVSNSIDLRDEIKAHDQVKDGILLDYSGQAIGNRSHSTDIIKELMDARILLEAMKCQQVSLVEELHRVRQENDRLVETLSNSKKAEIHPILDEHHISENGTLESQSESMTDLEVRLGKMTKDIEDVGLLNDLDDHISHSSCQDHVGNEATKAILRLQEELASLQVTYHTRLCTISEENKKLRGIVAAKEDELYALHTDWERASLELTSFLLDGAKSIKDASGQIESIACSFPRHNVWVGEHVKKAATICMEKEQTILRLEKNLVDAQSTILQTQEKLISLRSATIALTEIQYTEANMVDLQDHAKTTFLEAKGLQTDIVSTDMVRSRLGTSTAETEQDPRTNSYAKTSALTDIENQVEMAKQGLNETKVAFNMSRVDAEMYLSTFQAEIHRAFSLYKSLVEDFMKEIREMRKNLVEFKENHKVVQVPRVENQLEEVCSNQMQENQLPILHPIVAELVSLNNRLDTVNVYLRSIHDSQVMFGDSDGWTTDISTPSSILSDDENESPSGVTEQPPALMSEGGSKCSSNQESEKLDRDMKSLSRVRKEHLFLKKQFNMAYEAFVKLDVQLAAVFKDKEYEGESSMQSLECVKPDGKDTSKDVLNQLQNPDFVNQEKACKTSCFFSKFEEARATMNEADDMLNLLLKANKEAKMLTGRWKQVAEELMAEKASLIEEIKQLKFDVHLRDKEHAILEEQSHCSSIQLANSVSMLEVSFQHMQKEAEDLCHIVYSDALAMIQGFQHRICESRSSLEDIFAETMKKSFASFVIQQCHIREYINKFGLGADYGLWPSRLHEEIMDHVETLRIGQNHYMSNVVHGEEEENYSAFATIDDLINENSKLKKELERKNILLSGLLFDFSLLQESASTRKDMKDEAERLFTALSQVQHELKMKKHQLDDMVVRYEKLERCLADTEAALCDTKSGLEHAEETVDSLSYQNAELRGLLEDLYLKKSETEEQLEEQREIVRSLEKEIYITASSAQEQFLVSLEGITDDLKRVSSERDQLCEQVNSLQDRLEMAYAIADENEAIAVEARQESEASKIYAEEKEEEVKILEHSVEELDCTINVLEKKVNEMEEELERHHMIRESLELELQALNQRLLTVENFRDCRDSDNNNVDQFEDQISRKLHNRCLELQEVHAQIKDLEDEKEEQVNEIKQCKEYISELLIHAEAQAFQYQQKYKNLEAMVSAVKIDSSKSVSEASLLDKTEKNPVRARGSSSPFRCIGNLVQQMNTEKDQELSLARLRLEELEALASSRQKEICMLNTKLAATESMTHDVIRDLLGVKLDMTNYANLINQNQLQKLIEDAAQQTQEFIAMEQEIHNLRRQINDLLEERDRRITEIRSKEADILASKMRVAQLQERVQLLTTQNEMLKADKTKLQRRAAELDDMIKKLLGTEPTERQSHSTSKACNSDNNNSNGNELGKRLANSDKLLLRVNNELGQYRQPEKRLR